MQPHKKPDYPTNLLFFDTETKPKYHKDKPDSEFHEFWLGHIIAYRREGNNRTRLIDRPLDSIDDFWETLVSRLDLKRPLWCFAHNIIFDLTILDCWQLADKYGIDIQMPVLDDPPVILCCQHERGKVNFIDTYNYWKCSVADIGASIGMDKLTMPNHRRVNQEWRDYCRRDVDILSRAVDNLINWLSSNDLGPLSYTIASIALNTYKHRFMPHNTIHIHDNEQILELERKAYHGGLTHSYYIGKIKGPIYKLDVNSLYPSVMLNSYPVKPVTSDHVRTKRELHWWLRYNGAVAECIIDSDVNPYPLHDGERLLEATGQYRTVLCGPELYDALERGDVHSIGKMQLYEMDDIFSDYVNYFHKQRLIYKKSNDSVGSMFCKYLLNSLYGKFGQRRVLWQDLTYEKLAAMYEDRGLTIPELYEDENSLPDFSFGTQHWQPIDYPEPITIRYVGGCLQVRVEAGEHHESSPIIAAYVTSYARSRMRALRDIAGSSNVFYCDTDSLFVNQKGYDNLAKRKEISNNELGKLKLEEILPTLTIYGPKDYLAGTKRVVKGIRKDAKPLCPDCLVELDSHSKCSRCGIRYRDHSVFRQTQFEKVKGILRREPLPYVEVKQVIKKLGRQYSKGTIGPDGWTRYPVLTLDQTPTW